MKQTTFNPSFNLVLAAVILISAPQVRAEDSKDIDLLTFDRLPDISQQVAAPAVAPPTAPPVELAPEPVKPVVDQPVADMRKPEPVKPPVKNQPKPKAKPVVAKKSDPVPPAQPNLMPQLTAKEIAKEGVKTEAPVVPALDERKPLPPLATEASEVIPKLSVPPVVTAPAAAKPFVAPATPAFRLIETEDTLKIVVKDEPDLSGDYTVAPDGTVDLQLVGKLKASGVTPGTFAKVVEAAYRDGYLVNPRVAIEFGEQAP